LSPPTPGVAGQVPLSAAGRATYTSNATGTSGTSTGVVTFSVGGQIFTGVTLAGTWKLNADGSVSETVQQTSPPGFLLHFIDYLSPDGNTSAFVAIDAGANVSGTGTRR